MRKCGNAPPPAPSRGPADERRGGGRTAGGEPGVPAMSIETWGIGEAGRPHRRADAELTRGGGDHPMMDTLPAAFEAFAEARPAPADGGEIERLRALLAIREKGAREDAGCFASLQDELESRDAALRESQAALIVAREGHAASERAMAEARASAATAFAAVCEARGYEALCGDPSGLAHNLISAGKALADIIAPPLAATDPNPAPAANTPTPGINRNTGRPCGHEYVLVRQGAWECALCGDREFFADKPTPAQRPAPAADTGGGHEG